MSATFLERDEIRELTGRAYVRMQIAALARMGIPFFVNDIGRPVVARSAVEGRVPAKAQPERKKWEPQGFK